MNYFIKILIMFSLVLSVVTSHLMTTKAATKSSSKTKILKEIEMIGFTSGLQSHYGTGLKKDGTVWGWTYQKSYKGHAKKPTYFKSVPSLTKITQIERSSGVENYALKRDGTVLSWKGLGNPETKPRTIKGLTSIKKIATGYFLAGLKKDGTVWIYGENDNSKPLTGMNWVTKPKKITGLSHVIDIAAGDSELIALKKDGTVWVYGHNVIDGTKKFSPRKIKELTGIKEIKINDSGYHFVLRSDGRVYAWNYWLYEGGDFLGLYKAKTPELLTNSTFAE